MARKITPFMMFTGSAAEEMELNVSLFPGSAVRHIERYGPGELGAAAGA